MAKKLVTDFVQPAPAKRVVAGSSQPVVLGERTLGKEVAQNETTRPVATANALEPASGGVVPHSLRRKILLSVGVLSVICVLAFGGYVTLRHFERHSTPAITPVQAKAVPVQPRPVQEEDITSHLLFVGDVFWGRAIETAAQRSGKGPANLFRGLTAADKQGYDAWIGDMECPVTNKDIPYRTQVDSLVFNCRPEYTGAAAQWFDVMTLANNHTANNDGKWGLGQTRANLESAGIQYFGTYDMNDESDICEVVSVKAHETNNPSNGFQIPVAMCGYDYVGNVMPKESEMQLMRRYAKVMPVFAMPHMGVEYRATAEPAKVTVFRQLIDNGADVVVGDHPHVVQNSEVYKGRLIAYSTGNFLFDQQILGRDTTEALGVGVSISMNDSRAIQSYKDVAPSCKAYKDNCLTKLEATVTQRPAFAVAYDFQCFDEASGTPVRATEAVCNQIKARATVTDLQGLSQAW